MKRLANIVGRRFAGLNHHDDMIDQSGENQCIRFLTLEVQRVDCLDCDNVGKVSHGFADLCFYYPHAFERYALDLSKHVTIQDAARRLSLS